VNGEHEDRDFARDTSPEALEVFYEIQRRIPMSQKADDVFALSEGLMEAQKAGVRLRHPGADEREVFLRTMVLRVGREMVRKAYGWDADEPA